MGMVLTPSHAAELGMDVPASTRKHNRSKAKARAKAKAKEAKGSPEPQRSIIKDKEAPTYRVNPSPHPDKAMADLLLRVNALELSVSNLTRELAVARGQAAPFSGVAVPNNVVPMRAAVQQANHQTQGPKRAPTGVVSQPLPVTGNEAEVLLLPAPESVPTPTKRGDYEPKLVGKVDSISSAANDDDVHPPEVVADLNAITDESADDIAKLAFGYGMDLIEAAEILYREYSRREKHCYHTHDKSRADVQLSRLLAQKGIVEHGSHVYHKSEDTKYSAFDRKVTALAPKLAVRAVMTRGMYYKSSSYWAPLVPGEAKYRKKMLVRNLVNNRRASPESFAGIQQLSRTLYVGATPTSEAQIKAFGTWWFEAKNRVRSFVGLKPKIRDENLRTTQGNTGSLDTSTPSNKPLPVDLTPDVLESMGSHELARRYQRTRASY